MIISKTPLRISFVGGGSDIGWFYEKYGGAVVSTAINKYIYITVNKKFDHKIRASYSKTEIVEDVSRLKHELIRESLKYVGIQSSIEITSISDIPSEGTGLGSSSSYTVGLLHALSAYKSKFVTAENLARDACKIEIENLKKPIGKQDQYIASYGGLRFFQFHPDGSVQTEIIIIDPKVKERLQRNLLMFYTGLTRSSSGLLRSQKRSVENNKNKLDLMKKMVEMAHDAKVCLEKGNLGLFGKILHENWMLKKELSDGISNIQIDTWYSTARKNGAIGGKITGAGGGGFLLLYANYNTHSNIIKALSRIKPVKFSIEPEGSKIIFVEE